MSKLIKTRSDKHGEMKALLTRLETNYSDADAAQLRALDAEYQKLNELCEIEARALIAGKTLDEVMDKRVITTPHNGTDAEIRSAFVNYIRTGDMTEIRQLNSFTSDVAGGASINVPTNLLSTIQKTLASVSVMRQLPGIHVVQTTSTTNLPIVGTGVTAVWKDQNPSASYSETDPAFTSAQLGAFKLTALIKLSDELVQDAATDLEATIASEIGVAFGTAEELSFISGSGLLQPKGLLRFTAAGGENVLTQNLGSASGSIMADMIDGYFQMPANLRQTAVYVVGSAMASVMRKSRSTTGEFLWETSVVVGSPSTFNGVPVYESMGAPSSWGAGVVGALVCPQFCYIGDRGGYNLTRLMELYKAEGNVGYIASKRTDFTLTKGKALVKYIAAVV